MLRSLTITWLFACTGCQYPPLSPAFEAESCTLSSACRSQNASFPVCDLSLNGGTCVACTSTEHELCTNNTPRCENNNCVTCAEDVRDCGAGGICLPIGACAGPNNILHANSNGSSDPDCGETSKPCTLDKALAIIATATGKTVIKLDTPGPYRAFVNNNYIVDTNVTLDMRGATLDRNLDGPILEIRPGRTVTLIGGTIQNATGANGDGILCGGTLTVTGTTIKMTEKSAINMAGGCNLVATQVNVSSTSLRGGTFVPGILDNGDSITLSRSTIVGNRGGGVLVGAGTFKLVGNALLNNGDFMSSVGGLRIITSQNAENRLDFNTISKSTIQDGGTSGGIDCNAGATFVARYNILWNNKPNTSGTPAQISGGCKFTYSDAAPSAIPASNAVSNNLNMDPTLVNETNDARLKMNSPAIGYADPGANLTGLAAIDIDGDMRALRTGKGADIGADQYKP